MALVELVFTLLELGPNSRTSERFCLASELSTFLTQWTSKPLKVVELTGKKLGKLFKYIVFS